MRTLWIGCTAALAASLADGQLTTTQGFGSDDAQGRAAVPGRRNVVGSQTGGLATPVSLATPMQHYWARYHDGAGSSEDYGYDVAVDAAGNAYVTGGATNELGVTELVVVKYTPLGVEEWAVTYPAPGGGPDYGTCIAVDPSGKIVVGGDVVSASGDGDLVALKLDPQGNVLWSRVFNGTGNGYDGMGGGRSLALDAAGNVFIGGYTWDAVNDFDSLILKYDPSGTLLWTAIYDGNAHSTDDNYDLAVDAAGNVYAAAETTVLGQGRNLVALKYNGSNGSLLWDVDYDGGGSDVVNALALDASGNAYVVGISPGVSTGDDFATMKVDTNGVLQWVRRYDGPYSRDDGPWDVAVSSTGLVAVTGFSVNRYSDSTTATVAYDTLGNLAWVQRFDASTIYFGDDEGIEVKFDAAGNAWVCGAGWDGPEHGSEAVLLRYSPSGVQTFAAVHDGTGHGDEAAFGLAFHGAAVVVGGYSQRGQRHVDTMVLRFGPVAQGQTALGAPGFPELPPAALGSELAPPSLAPGQEPLPGTAGRPERPTPARRSAR